MPNSPLDAANKRLADEQERAENAEPITVGAGGGRVRELGSNSPIPAPAGTTPAGTGELVTPIQGQIGSVGGGENVAALRAKIAQLEATIRRSKKIERSHSVVLVPITIASAEDAEYILFQSEETASYTLLRITVQDVSNGVSSAVNYTDYTLSHAEGEVVEPSTKFVVTLSNTSSERIFIQAEFRSRGV